MFFNSLTNKWYEIVGDGKPGDKVGVLLKGWYGSRKNVEDKDKVFDPPRTLKGGTYCREVERKL